MELISQEKIEAARVRRNAMGSRLLLLRLRKFHYEYAPECYKSQCVPAVIREDPLIALGRRHFEEEAAKLTPIKYDAKSKVAAILAAVGRYYQIEVCQIVGRRLTANLVRPRQVAMFIATEMTAISFPWLGNLLNRDHSTVIYGHRIIKERKLRDPVLAIQVETIMAQVDRWEGPLGAGQRRAYESEIWTPDRISRLVALRQDGVKWWKIAQELGVTSSGVCQQKYAKIMTELASFQRMTA